MTNAFVQKTQDCSVGLFLTRTQAAQDMWKEFALKAWNERKARRAEMANRVLH
jgi:hypothetical protein